MLFLRLMRFKTILPHPACLQTVLTSPVAWFLGSDTALILLTYEFSQHMHFILPFGCLTF